MKCYVMKDLLPNYIDDLNSEETDAEIRAHLKICSTCRRLYQEREKASSQELAEGEKDIGFLKQLKRSIRIRNRAVAVSTCIFLILGLLFLKYYQVPLSFDPECMGVKIFQAVPMTGRDGKLLWLDADSLDFSTSQAVIAGDYEVLDLIQIFYQNLSYVSQQSSARTIRRDGEEIRVIYYCYTESLWDFLFMKHDTKNFSEGSSFGSYLYGNQFQREDYQPGMKEIYYLPIKNFSRIEKLSDEEYDNQKENAVLVWRGII